MFTKRRRFAIGGSRSGISSLIGAIFFVLVVFLIFTSTVLIFNKFTGYAGAFKQVNQDDIQAKDTVASVSNLDFGGVVPASVLTSGTATANSGSPTMSLLPVQNMNFTDNMDGWTFSRDYELALHDASITNYPLNVLPGVDVFLLDVSNTDPVSVSSAVMEVQLAANPSFDVPASLQVAPAGWCVSVSPPPSPGAPAVITWLAAPPVAGHCVSPTPAQCDTNGVLSPALVVPPANSLTFAWTAVLPAVTELVHLRRDAHLGGHRSAELRPAAPACGSHVPNDGRNHEHGLSKRHLPI